jgi:WD40 repeat protein
MCAIPTSDSKNDRIASAGADGSVRIWDLDGVVTCVRTLTGHVDQVQVLCTVYGDKQGILASGGRDGKIRLWNTETGACVHTIAVGSPVYALSQCWPQKGNPRAVLGVGTRDGAIFIALHSELFR